MCLFVLQESGKPPESSPSWSLPYRESYVPSCGPAEGSHTHSAECPQRTRVPPPLHPSTHRKPQRAARSAAVPQRRSTASVAIETHFYSELLQLSLCANGSWGSENKRNDGLKLEPARSPHTARSRCWARCGSKCITFSMLHMWGDFRMTLRRSVGQFLREESYIRRGDDSILVLWSALS